MTCASRGPATTERDSAGALAGFGARIGPFRRRLDEMLLAFLEEKERMLPGAERTRQLARALRSLVEGGGKRLRPALVYFTYHGCGGRDEDAVLPLAAAAEFLHSYLLIHDDIMDHSEVRRGRPSAHVQFARIHRENGWPGNAEDFGRSMAILVGDLAYTWAIELYHRARQTAALRGSSAEGLAALDRVFSAMCEEVIAGQYLEMHLPYREDPSDGELLDVLRFKSGRYSVERPMELGAILAGRSGEVLQPLAAFGSALGEVFQLQDDILGVFGEEAAVGKPVGSDLAEGKRTFLVHEALRLAPPEMAEALRGVLGRADLSETDVSTAREIIRASGALEAVQSMIDERLGVARRALDRLALTPDAHSFFEGLIAYSRERDR